MKKYLVLLSILFIITLFCVIFIKLASQKPKKSTPDKHIYKVRRRRIPVIEIKPLEVKRQIPHEFPETQPPPSTELVELIQKIEELSHHRNPEIYIKILAKIQYYVSKGDLQDLYYITKKALTCSDVRTKALLVITLGCNKSPVCRKALLSLIKPSEHRWVKLAAIYALYTAPIGEKMPLAKREKFFDHLFLEWALENEFDIDMEYGAKRAGMTLEDFRFFMDPDPNKFWDESKLALLSPEERKKAELYTKTGLAELHYIPTDSFLLYTSKIKNREELKVLFEFIKLANSEEDTQLINMHLLIMLDTSSNFAISQWISLKDVKPEFKGYVMGILMDSSNPKAFRKFVKMYQEETDSRLIEAYAIAFSGTTSKKYARILIDKYNMKLSNRANRRLAEIIGTMHNKVALAKVDEILRTSNDHDILYSCMGGVLTSMQVRVYGSIGWRFFRDKIEIIKKYYHRMTPGVKRMIFSELSSIVRLNPGAKIIKDTFIQLMNSEDDQEVLKYARECKWK